jgi:hypothetical protein
VHAFRGVLGNPCLDQNTLKVADIIKTTLNRDEPHGARCLDQGSNDGQCAYSETYDAASGVKFAEMGFHGIDHPSLPKRRSPESRTAWASLKRSFDLGDVVAVSLDMVYSIHLRLVRQEGRSHVLSSGGQLPFGFPN